MKNFEWIKYHKLAKKLYDQKDEEYLRSAISRDYYACFNLSKNYLIKQKRYIPIHSSRSHNQISQIMQNSSNEKEVSIGKQLNTLRKIRNNADYDSDSETSIMLQKSKNRIENYAEEIIQTIQELEKENKA